MRADEEHNEGELQKVVENEVASYSSGSIDIFGITGKQSPDITDLKDEENDPIYRQY